MANSNINFSLGFSADTSKARAELQKLQSDLNKLNVPSNLGENFFNEKDLDKARVTLSALEATLKKSTNAAGNLDLTKFNNSLKQSGMSLAQYKTTLMQLGPQGASTFNQLTNSILNAEVSLKRTNTLAAKFWDGLKRTAGWQIQSTMIHKFTGAIQQAYGYAQDLNESLNNIRIVTGKSTEDMAKFAKEANKAAQSLSTTTTAYTDAALIFYQQGLSGEEVTKRTDTVIKMANVTGQSAEEVSSYMTAIWNNFDDGSKSLEHYADVITALGATTASSSSEIAEGLEKFAAIGNTVGLSYEYATSALATVVAQTRQSADTVGTAFKTLFARIQDLEVGKTLDDGTSLGKYAQALESIGVHIKDASGQVKSMDSILDEMGSKWGSISKDTQIAVAQTVAGTRQYAQLLALMDNWGEFQKNVNTANNAEGALQEQADIYAESWEAAQKRVKAAAQGIYDSILNDEFFIKLSNGFADFLQGVEKVIDGLGGIKGVLITLTPLITNLFSKQINQSIQSAVLGFQNLVGVTSKQNAKIRAEAISLQKGLYQGTKAEAAWDKQYKIQQYLIDNANTLNEIQKNTLQIILDQNKAELEKAQILEDQSNAKNQDYLRVRNQSSDEAYLSAAEQAEVNDKKTQVLGTKKKGGKKYSTVTLTDNDESKALESQYRISDRALLEKLTETRRQESILNRLNESIGDPETFLKYNAWSNESDSKVGADIQTRLQENVDKAKEAIKKENIGKDFKEIYKEDETQWKAYSTETQDVLKAIKGILAEVEKKAKEATEDADAMEKRLNQRRTEKGLKAIDSNQFGIDEDVAAEYERHKVASQDPIPKIDELNDDSQITQKRIENYQALSQSVMAVSSAMNGLNSLMDIWKNEDTSFGDKILQTFSTLAFVIPSVTMALNKDTISKTKNAAAELANLLTKKISIKASLQKARATAAETAGVEADTAATKANTAAKLLGNPVLLAAAAAVIALAAAYKIYTEHLAKETEAAEEHYQSVKDQQQGLEETKTNIDNVCKSYKNLIDEQEESGKTNKEIKSQILEMCDQYDLLDIKLKLLTSDYADYNNILKEAQQQANENLLNNLQEQDSAAGDVLNAKANEKNAKISGQKLWNNFGAQVTRGPLNSIGQVMNLGQEGLEVTGGDTAQTSKFLEEILNASGFSDGETKSIVDQFKWTKTAKVDFGSHVDDIGANWKEIQGIISKYNGIFAYGGGNTYKTISDYFNDNKDLFTEAANRATQRKQAKLESIGNKQGPINSVIDYNNAVSNIRAEASKEGIDKAEIEDYIKKQYTNDDTIKYVMQDAIARQKAASETGKKLDDITTEDMSAYLTSLENLSDAEVKYLYNNLSLLKDADKSIEEVVHQAGSLIQNDQIKSDLERIKQALSGDTIDFDILYSDKTYADRIGIDKESLQLMDDASARLAILSSSTEAYLTELSNRTEAEKEAAELEKTKAENNAIDWFRASYNDYTSSNDEILQKIQEYSDKMDEYIEKTSSEQRVALHNFYNKYKDDFDTFEELKDAANGTNQDITNYYNMLGDSEEERKENFELLIQLQGRLGNQFKKYSVQVQTATGKYEEMVISSAELAQQLEQVKILHESINKSLDEWQSTYKSLVDISAEYNRNNLLTLDNFQALMDMSPEQLNALEIENGQLKVNQELIKQNVIAKIQDSIATAEQEAAINLLAIAEGDAAVQTAQFKKYIELTQDDLNNFTTEQARIELAKYAEDINAIIQKDGSSQSKAAANAVMEDLNKRRQIGQLAIDSLSKNFDDFMGGIGSSAKKIKYYTDEFDRYWEFKKHIEETTHAIEELQEAQSHLFGQELINNLNEVNKLLAQNKANYEALYEAQKVERQELQQSLQGYFNFDADGMITNYAEGTSALFNAQNSMSEEAYEKLKKDLERYDSLVYSEMVDTADNIKKVTEETLANNNKIWSTEIQLELDTKQAERDFNSFLHKVTTDFKKANKDLSKEMSYIMSQANTYNLDDGTLSTRLREIRNINAEIAVLEAGGQSDLFSSLSEAQNALKEKTEALRNDAEALYDLYNQAWDTYIEGMDQAADHFDKVINEYSRLDEELEHQARLSELLYGDEAYDKIVAIKDAQAKNSLGVLDSFRQQSEFWMGEYQKAVSEYGEDSEAAEEALQHYNDAVSALHSEEEKYLEIIQAKYVATIQNIVKEAKNASAGGDASWARTTWSDSKKKTDGIYDDTERLYELTTLENKWNKLISDTTGLQNQQKIREAMEAQLTALREKGELTEYDIGLAEKELAVTQAQIALEEAQNAKNSMQMIRDTAGNWSYQYVADDNDVADKQQKYLDTIQDKYEYIKTANEKALDDILTLEDEFWTRYQEIMTDTSLSQEEKEKRTQYIYDLYYGESGLLTRAYKQSALTEQQLNLTTAEETWALYKQSEENYGTMTTKQKEFIDKMRDGSVLTLEDLRDQGARINSESLVAWDTTVKAMSDAYNADDGKSLKSQVQAAMESGSTAMANYNADVQLGCETAGEDFRKIGAAVDEVNDKIDALSSKTGQYVADHQGQLDNFRQTVNELGKSWETVAGIVTTNYTAMENYEAQAWKAVSAAKAAANAMQSIGGSGGGSGETQIQKAMKNINYGINEYGNDGVTAVGVWAGDNKIFGEDVDDDRTGNYSTMIKTAVYSYLADQGFNEDEINEEMAKVDWDKNIKYTGGNAYNLQGQNLTKFATGGYTGEWGDEGKIAMLHEKELVLNEKDTENMLEIVNFVRDITASIGSSISDRMSQLMYEWDDAMNRLNGNNVRDAYEAAKENISNVFNITAEFPNANNVDDIRQAILSLPNLASQRAGYKFS